MDFLMSARPDGDGGVIISDAPLHLHRAAAVWLMNVHLQRELLNVTRPIPLRRFLPGTIVRC